MDSKEIDWSDFNETELQVISAHYQNLANGTNYSGLPYLSVVFEELAENLASIALLQPGNANKLANELLTINKVLLNTMPTPPTKNIDELAKLLSEEEIKNNLLYCTVSNSLIRFFANIIEQIIEAQEMAIKQEVKNATKH